MTAEEREIKIMTLISSAGQARSLAFEALACARQSDFEKADRLMAESRDKALDAHDAQTAFLRAQMSGEEVKLDLLLMHALDHLACANLAQDLVAEIIELKRGE